MAMTFISYAQNFEDVILWRAMRDVPNGFYIDVGAWDPDLDSVTRAFSERGWRGINIEPLTEGHARLLKRRPRDVNLAVAAGAAADSLDFHEIEQTALSTADPVLAGRYAALGLRVTRRRVDQLTLAEICRAHAPADIHFLKVDCEGQEWAVLAGADFTKYRPWVVLVEATVPCSQEPAFAEWEPVLLKAGYRFAWFDGLNRFYVAAEHFERLAPLIAVPPNCFDNFIRALDVASAATALRPHAALADPAPTTLSMEQRIQLATRCRDCDDLLKVEDAGTVLTDADGTRVQVMHNGVRVPADGYCGPWMTDLITRCRGHHEPQEERQFHAVMQALPTDATMIELGGNWSYYTAWFLRGAPGRRAVVLEPDPLNRAVGGQTMALNGFAAEELELNGATPRAAVADNLRVVFVEGFAGAVSTPATPFLTERSGMLLLPCFSVPHLMALHGMNRLDVLHCDTQGAELGVLQGCQALFQTGRIGWVLVSTHVPQISGDALTHHRCLELLRRNGAAVVAEHDPWESFSGDGLIVARFGAFPISWRPAPMTMARRHEALFRDPCHDLADAWAGGAALTARMEAFQEDVVRGSFQKLLLRPISPSDLAQLVMQLRQGMDFGTWLDIVLHSLEFRLHREQFGNAYWAAELGPSMATGALPVLPADSPVSCSAVEIRLERATALGHSGDRVLIPNDRVILPAVLAAGAWLPAQLDTFAERLDPARDYVLLDIGANVGLFSRQALRRFGNITVAHCVEPDEANHRALCANLSGLPGVDVTTHKMALGPETGTATFFRDAENCGNYSLHADAMRDRSFGQVQVPVVAAGPWLAETLPSTGSIVWKSDTQGSDEAIVAAAPWEVWRRVEIAVVELWRIRKPTVRMPEFLARVADMPHRQLGTRMVSVEDVAHYLDGDDWMFDDLYLWR